MKSVRDLFEAFNEALQPAPIDNEARDTIAAIGELVGIDIFDTAPNEVWTHTNMHRVLVAVMSMRQQLAIAKGFDSYVRTDTVLMPRVVV